MDEDADSSSKVSESKEPLLRGQLNSEADRAVDDEIQARSNSGRDIHNFFAHTKKPPVLVVCPSPDEGRVVSRYPISGSTYKKKGHAKGVSHAVCNTSANEDRFLGDISANGGHHDFLERANASTSIPRYRILQVKHSFVFPFTIISVLLDLKKFIHLIWIEFTSHVLTLTFRLTQVLPSNPARAIPPFPMLLLMAARALASQTDTSVLTPRKEEHTRDDFGAQWQRHVGIYVSSLVWAGFAWAFNMKRDVYARNYGIWYLSATLLYNAVYGFEVFVELRTSTAAR
ncbi:hypothetical protein E8E14_007791 [Neopestalotiopsis sp. 37M]|nr:hypothetical protein E8E14_007791 [Neopestalotiopsis sp. 37M]